MRTVAAATPGSTRPPTARHAPGRPPPARAGSGWPDRASPAATASLDRPHRITVRWGRSALPVRGDAAW